MVISFLKNPSFILVTIILLIADSFTGECSAQQKTPNVVRVTKVAAVIDGDTIEIEGGQRVRYLGIDTPEIGQPFYEEARNKNKELVLGKNVRLEVCKSEPRDKYGRLLAYVYVNQAMVNKEILISGYARILIIPPCGIEKAEEFRQYQKAAMEKKLGLWGRKTQVIITKDFIPASDAVRFIDERKAIYGKVMEVREGRSAIFIEIGNTAKTGLRVVIFKQDETNFRDNGIAPVTYYQGKKVVVYGKIKMYKGKIEVIVGSPSQIEVW